MRHWALALAAGLLCAVALLGVDAKEAVEKTAAAQTMYAEVVGTILAAQSLYTDTSEELSWMAGDLRVEEVKSESSECRAGEVLEVHYEQKLVPLLERLGIGDLVRGSLQREEKVEEGAWVAMGGLERLGRGELVNPGEHPTMDLGSPEAKVLVKMFAPLAPECHQKTAELLKELAAREPERVRVQIFDMASPQTTRPEMARERLTCATVLVNNRYEFTLGERKVSLSHRPNDPNSTYNSQDVITIAEQEIARLYPANASPETPKATPQ